MGELIHLGDMAHLPHQDVINHVNGIHAKVLAARAHPDVAEHYRNHHDEQEKSLLLDLQNYRDGLETRGAQARLRTVREKLRTADEQSEQLGFTSPEDRAAQRLAQFDSLEVATDIDNTVTDMSQGDYLLGNIPTSVFAEQALARDGRSAFPRVYVEHWQPYVRNHPHLFERAAHSSDVVIRHGVDEFSRHAQEHRWKVRVISANFRPFVHEVVKRAGLPVEKSNIHSVEPDSIVATDKASVLQMEAQKAPNIGRVYVGDGSSDEEAVNADTVIAYFALADSSFAQKLEMLAQRDPTLIYFTYRSFRDIQVKLADIDAKAQAQREIAA